MRASCSYRMNLSSNIGSKSEAKVSLVRVCRVAANLKQADLADRAGLTQETISNVERGAVAPRRKTARAIALALSVDVDQLWPEVGDG